jgi:hypothetical protein
MRRNLDTTDERSGEMSAPFSVGEELLILQKQIVQSFSIRDKTITEMLCRIVELEKQIEHLSKGTEP